MSAETPPCVGCHADHTGEDIVENPDCPLHGYDPDEEVNLGGCPWYLTRGLPDSHRQTCTFGCWSEPACETGEPDGGWPTPEAGAS